MIGKLPELTLNAILVHTTVEIPAKSFAKLDSYNDTNHYFDISKPDADNIRPSRVVVVPELIAANKTGIAYIGGIHVVLKTGGETIVAGDFVGTDTDEWTAINGVGFHVITVLTNDIVIRGIGGGGGSTGVRKAYVKTTPAGVKTVACYLDTDATGKEITVNCSVIGGTALNSAVARLVDGVLIFVAYIDGAWWCIGSPFQTSQVC